MACVANRSTTVRNAVSPIIKDRSNTPCEWPAASMSRISVTWLMWDIARSSRIMVTEMPRFRVGRPVAGSIASRQRNLGEGFRYISGRLHMMIGGILADVADVKNDGLVAEILPPMRGAEHLRPDVAGLVHDRRRAIAGVFHDLALLHEDERGPVIVAVPRHDPAGLDRQLAETEFTALDVGRLLFEVDRSQGNVGDADRFEHHFLAGVGFHLVGRAFTCEGGRSHGGRSGDGEGQGGALPKN